MNEMKEYMSARQQQRGIRIQQQEELHEEISGKGKSKAVMKGRQIPVDVDESDDTEYEDLSPNKREWREGLRQSRRAAMLESDMRRFHSTREGSSSGVLRMVDGEDKNDMGYLYEAMDKAKERLREKHPMAYQKWWRIIDARWESTLHHDLHATGINIVIPLTMMVRCSRGQSMSSQDYLGALTKE
ncbi:hypothetical protein Taro_041450 [Colocasia esculenta]|uniref:Uncharacterized protein n=1 Tax=Colocasia esculenta TaxID=4460 RepID=A0A843WBI6_COLES|nr:hypothetical protein [Colocasia esculenta]